MSDVQSPKFQRDGRGLVRITGTPYALIRSPELSEGPRGGRYAMWELIVWTEDGWEALNEPGWRTLRDAKAHVRSHPELLEASR